MLNMQYTTIQYQIQERNSKTKTLHRAKLDPKTGGITYTPANRKTPIAYDRHRHTLIETTPDGDQIELELDCDEEKENIESTLCAPVLLTSKAKKTTTVQQNIKARVADDACSPKKGTRATTRRGSRTLPVARSYAESTDPESSSSSPSTSDDDDEESDFEAPAANMVTFATNNRTITTGANNRGKTDKAAVIKNEQKGKLSARFKDECSDEESDLDEPPIKKSRTGRVAAAGTNKTDKKIRTIAADASRTTSRNKKSVRNETTETSDGSASDAPPPREVPSNFSSPIVKANWEELPDWRCAGAIDY